MMNTTLLLVLRILHILFQETNKNIKIKFIEMTWEIHLVYIIMEIAFNGITKKNYFEKYWCYKISLLLQSMVKILILAYSYQLSKIGPWSRIIKCLLCIM